MQTIKLINKSKSTITFKTIHTGSVSVRSGHTFEILEKIYTTDPQFEVLKSLGLVKFTDMPKQEEVLKEDVNIDPLDMELKELEKEARELKKSYRNSDKQTREVMKVRALQIQERISEINILKGQ